MSLLAGHHLLRALGFQSSRFSEELAYQRGLNDGAMLRDLEHSFYSAGGGLAPQALAQMIQSGLIPGAGIALPPNMGRYPYSSGHYASSESYDLSTAPWAHPLSAEGWMGRREGIQKEKMLRSLMRNPFMRQQFEMMAGGRIRLGGMDGRIQIERFPGGDFGGNPAAMAAYGFMDQIMRGAMASGLPPEGQMFMGFMQNALAHAMGGHHGSVGNSGLRRTPGGTNPFVDWLRGPRDFNPEQAPGLPGSPRGPFFPGVPGPFRGDQGLTGGFESSGILNDTSLTMEDKVVLLLMQIMKEFDKDIEAQARKVEQLQQQQNKGGKGGKGGGGSSPSIDIETMKLKRLIDKRSQMFDMLRQIIDKYNETAKNMIQSIGR